MEISFEWDHCEQDIEGIQPGGMNAIRPGVGA